LNPEPGAFCGAYDPDVRSALGGDSTLSWVARANRGVAAGDGKVFVATADCRLIALDADSGKEDLESHDLRYQFRLRDIGLALLRWWQGLRG
jgi:outer membrane protein assembly factor BamB